LILGITTGNHSLSINEDFIIAGIKIFPYNLKLFFDIEACEITDELVLLNDIARQQCGEVVEKLHESINNHNKIVNILEEYMLKKFCGNIDDKIKMIEYSIKTIKQHYGSAEINELAQYIGLSKRLLEKHFEKSVGVSPKLFSRIVRINQAADILFCKGNVVPVGKDQLPHLELTRVIARRFNDRFAAKKPVFPEPQPLLSQSPLILGLDGSQKMSKRRNNAIMLCATEDETANLIKKAKTDADRLIEYDPRKRPEISNLLLIASLCLGRAPEEIAREIGNGGAGTLKKMLTESINEYLKPLRKKRLELESNMDYIRQIIKNGVQKARQIGSETLEEVREVMNMKI